MPETFTRQTLIVKTSFSEVWHAKDASGIPVVVKIALNDGATARRLRNEIEALIEAEGPSTMPVLEFDAVDYSWYMMPVAAYNLAHAPGVKDVTLGIHVVEAIEEALHNLHGAGRPHRDLKPQNILWLEVDGEGRWVVADFGIIRNAPGTTTASLTVEDAFLGSLGWAAPEQHSNPHAATPVADVYAAGAIVTWVLTGKMFEDSNPLLPTDSAIRGVLQRALQRVPSRRYQTIAQFLEALRIASVAKPTTLEDLLRKKTFDRLGASILGDLSRADDAILALPDLNRDDSAAWLREAKSGLIESLTALCNGLSRNTSSLNFVDIDRFLIWCIDVLRVLTARAEHAEVEELATAVFEAIASLRQFKPGAEAVRWIGSLDRKSEIPIEHAVHASGGLAFFQEQARNKYASRVDSDLLKKLRRS